MRRGITLIELMVVIAIMAMFLGASIALMKRAGRLSELEAAEREIQSLLRRSRVAAMTTRTRIELAFDFTARTVEARLRRPVTFLAFEEPPGVTQIAGANGVIGQLAGSASLVRGRNGGGLGLGLDGVTPGRVTILNLPRLVDANEGLHLVADIFPTLGGAMTIASEGGRFTLGIDDEQHLAAEVGFTGGVIVPDGPPSTSSPLQARSAGRVPVGRWSHVELVVDDRGIRLFMDDVQQPTVGLKDPIPAVFEVWGDPSAESAGESFAALPAQGDPRIDPEEAAVEVDPFALDETQAPLVIGDGALFGPFYGVIDSLRLSRLRAADPVVLPDGVSFGIAPQPLTPADLELLDPDEARALFPETFRRGVVRVYFAPDGLLDPRFHSRPVTVYLRNQHGAVTRLRIELLGTTP